MPLISIISSPDTQLLSAVWSTESRPEDHTLQSTAFRMRWETLANTAVTLTTKWESLPCRGAFPIYLPTSKSAGKRLYQLLPQHITYSYNEANINMTMKLISTSLPGPVRRGVGKLCVPYLPSEIKESLRRLSHGY